jgi:hypothetical protein
MDPAGGLYLCRMWSLLQRAIKIYYYDYKTMKVSFQINLRWRWIVMGTIVVHFAIWLVFAVFWYITALAHYDFEPNPPNKTCVTGGKDFVTIFLASVEAQVIIFQIQNIIFKHTGILAISKEG